MSDSDPVRPAEDQPAGGLWGGDPDSLPHPTPGRSADKPPAELRQRAAREPVANTNSGTLDTVMLASFVCITGVP